MSVAGRQQRLVAAATTSLSTEMQTIRRTVLDKVDSVQLSIIQQRTDVTELKRSLTDTETRLSRLQQSFLALSDDLDQLHSQQQVDRYLETIIHKLIGYGRALRLVVCCVDHESTGDRQQPSRQHTPTPQRAHGACTCPLRFTTHSQFTFLLHCRLFHLLQLELIFITSVTLYPKC